MPTWGWILIAIGILAVILVAVWAMLRVRRTKELRSAFGPEYERTVQERGSRQDAESELPLVHAPAEDAHAGAELMAFESDHVVARGVGDAARRLQ